MNMGTRYTFEGDRKKAMGLRPEGVRQMFILKNAMRFQGLNQLKRIAILNDGSRIVCSSVFGIDTIHIMAQSGGGVASIKKAYFCWCNSCFAEGIVTEVIGEYEEFGPFWKNIDANFLSDRFYPNYCQFPYDSSIRRYEGIRYRVLVCQGEKGHDKEFICIPSDFAGHEENDRVIVLYMGIWDGDTQKAPLYLEKFAECKCTDIDGNIFLCEACAAKHREDWIDSEADGSFIVTTLEVAGING